MKITINITRKEKEHMEHCDTENDACGIVQSIIKKVKKEIFENG